MELTRPHVDVPLGGLPLAGLQLLAIGLAAALSYRYLELPVRTGAVGRNVRQWWRSENRRFLTTGTRWTAGGCLAAVFAAGLGYALVHAAPARPPSYLQARATSRISRVAPTAPSPSLMRRTLPCLTLGRVAPDSRLDHELALAESIDPRVTAVGDSVMLGAAPQMADAVEGGVDVDAKVGRQVSAVIDLLRTRRDSGHLGPVVLLHIGNNGVFTDGEMDDLMRLLRCEYRVVFVNLKEPRPWEGPNDQVIANGVARYANAMMIDWRTASIDHPELFYDDGIHLRPDGARAYASLIARTVNAT
jgi:hypothetical protein